MIDRTLLSDPVVLGKIGACFGVNGWLRIFSFTENIESIFTYQPWFVKITEKWKQIELEAWRYHNRKLIFKLKDVDNRNAANLFINYEIVVDSSQLPRLEEEFYYWKELIGCQVVSTSGFVFGKVVGIIETGSNDVLIVQNSLKKELLIPFLHGKVIQKVVVNSKKIKVSWNSGF